MSQRDIRTMNMAEGQKIESDDVMKRLGDLSYRNMGALSRAGLFDSGKALIVGTGLRVEPSSGLTVTVPSGSVFQRFIDVIPCVENDSQTVTLDAASGVSRTDIIEAQIKSVTDKDDYSQSATVASGATIAITNESIKRDIKYYLSARKQTNTTTPTAATAGTLTGTVSIATTIDLSEKYLINLSDGEDGSFQEIDCRGATPEATTLVEINAAINAAVGRTMATTGGGDVGVLTGDGTSKTSSFTIKPPVTDSDKDALQVIYGVSVGGIYKYTYEGTNEWFKIAEIDMGAATTTITSGLIRNIDQKSTWASESDEILVKNPVYENNFDGGLIPIGSIISYIPGYFGDGSNGSYTGVALTLPDSWQECDGSVLNDSESPIFNGASRYLPNLTDDRFLMGDTSTGGIGGANDGHYHGMGTGADLNITASGSHYHTTTLTGWAGGVGQAAGGWGSDNSSQGTFANNTDSKTHTHADTDFAGSIGLVTGGFDGNAAGSNLPKYLSCKYIMRVK